MTRRTAVLALFGALAGYFALLMLNVHVVMPVWLITLTAAGGVLCILVALAACIVIFEMNPATYQSQFQRGRHDW